MRYGSHRARTARWTAPTRHRSHRAATPCTRDIDEAGEHRADVTGAPHEPRVDDRRVEHAGAPQVTQRLRHPCDIQAGRHEADDRLHLNRLRVDRRVCPAAP
ncbi:hypothetical protein BvRS1_18080 [Burkholderia vietnamiensis]|jgi:hypothetical protein|nr:hypothetical protein WL96_11705 [Burkholderia vietnamiensis]KVE17067.1 hypothetical protein WI92_05810 [Burkholderia vietnamiensis]KVR64033.1 hypothetical protein WK24_22150 [Burkholderia vietnamiensis]KVS15981.1 hypothetical protein WK29_14730 [Burkholderia vietnamiensis]KVS21575.1 hypothetical protein WK34_22435 [Burkholderia vietnamiensis]